MVKKLNLNALQTGANTQASEQDEMEIIKETPQEIPQEPVSQNKKSLISLKKDTPETNKILLEEAKVLPIENSEEKHAAPKKAKISLRGINKPQIINEQESLPSNGTTNGLTPNTNTSSEIITIEETAPIVSQEVITTENSPLLSQETDTIIALENTINEEDIIKEEEKKEEIVAIMDGDTNCAIIKDDFQEIFSNYKGSFVEVKEEPKEIKAEEVKVEAIQTPIVNISSADNAVSEIAQEPEKKIESILPENTPTENEQVISEVLQTINEVSQEENITTENITSEKTPLEKIAETKKKTWNKKIVVSGAISVLCLGVFGFVITQNSFTTSSVIDTNNIEAQNTPPIIENNTTQTEEPITTPPTIPEPQNTPSEEVTEVQNTNNIENTPIVKENENNSIDNNENNDRINKRLQNFLIKKYKIK